MNMGLQGPIILDQLGNITLARRGIINLEVLRRSRISATKSSWQVGIRATTESTSHTQYIK